MSPLPTFETELKKLNGEQLRAVKKIEGPMMVLAGPGTGKTQVVAMRLGQILRLTQLEARNILALTFTEAGAVALRERAVSLLGATAYQLGIYTFHGFANEVITTFPYVFARKNELEQLNELDRFLLLEKILADHPEWELLRPLRAPGQFIKNFGAQIKTCKQEAIKPEDLVTLAKSEKTETKNKLQLEQFERDRARLIQFSELYAAYQTELVQSNFYDYEDLILLVIEALENNPEVRAFFQEKYQYLLVDEYQDTNNAQNRLVEVLVNFFPNPNLFVVGDDKQAIMRFQGASVTNMLHFAKKYPSLETVTLSKNYRSSPEILKAADCLISHNHVQIQQYLPELSVALEATKKTQGKPKYLVFASQLAEWTHMVNLLRDAHKAGTPWSEMAVLLRRNDQVRSFRDFAQKMELPITGASNLSIINYPIIQTLLQCLRAVSNPRDDRAAYSLVRLLANRKHRLKLFETIANPSHSRTSFLERVAATKELAQYSKIVLDIHQRLELLTLGDLLLELLDTTRLIEQAEAARELEQLEVLRAFIGLAEEFSRRNNRASVASFLQYLATMEDHGIPLEVQNVGAEETGIHLSTLHKAKGLEFELVILSGVDNQNYQIRSSRNLVKLPGEITGLKNWQQDVTDDERRLFYVGMTRAKSALYLTMARQSDDGRELLPCQFVEECREFLTSESIELTKKTLSKSLQSSFQRQNSEIINDEELAYFRQRIQNNPFSATALRTYQFCPRQYLLTQVLKFPGPSSPALQYGNAVHKALELFGRDHRLSKKLPSQALLLEYFSEAVKQMVPPNDRAPMIGQGSSVLTAYYQKVLAHSPAPLHTEYSFTRDRVMLNDIWLTGKFDRIELIDPKTKTVRVIDYKTSSTAKTRNFIEGLTKDSDGSIKQQLVFYSLLASLSKGFPYRIGEYVVEFIDDKQTFRREVFQIAASLTQDLATTIEQTYKEITNLTSFAHSRAEFDKGCELCQLFVRL